MDNPIPQYREFVATLVRGAPDNLGGETFQYWIRHPETLRERLLEALTGNGQTEKSVKAKPEQIQPATPTQLPTYPAVGEVFELTLEPVMALEMVKADGYDPTNWKYEGQEITERQTRRFTLVNVGCQRNFKNLCKALKEHGEIPAGQWREALKAKYRQDGKRPVGVADASWVYPTGAPSFPYVDSDGDSSFSWCDDGYDFDGDWWWLVGVSK